VRSNFLAQLLMRGIDDRKIKIAMMQDARGSHPFQPVKCISAVEIITAALPIVSASTWRKIPCMFSLSCECECPPWE